MSAIVGFDPVKFIHDVLVNPETARPFELYAAQEGFIREAFTPLADGRLPYSELVYSCIKKSGKTTMQAMLLILAVRALGGRFAEGYIAANDLEQAISRVFKMCVRIVEASPLLKRECRIRADRIDFSATGGFIQAIASDYAGAAGAEPTISGFDELWGFMSERSHRFWDESVPTPTKKVSVRLTMSYAGFTGESDLLEQLVQRGLAGEEIAPCLYRQPGMLMFLSHEPIAPWQTPEWLEQMRATLRPNAYLRMIENRFTSGESGFVDMKWWDACVRPDVHPIIADPSLSICVGVDASVKRDSTAIVAVTWDRATKTAHLVWHRIFQPTPDEPLDFEHTIEATLLELRHRFRIRTVYFDPYQMISSAQRLRNAGVPMQEFPQSMPNLTEASSNLYELIKSNNLIAYEDDAIRLAISRAVAIEGARGWRIAKEKQAHKIDAVIALAQAALAAVQEGTRNRGGGTARLTGLAGVAGAHARSTPPALGERPVMPLPPIAAQPPAPWTYDSLRACPLPAHRRRTR